MWTFNDHKAILFKDCYGEAKQGEHKFTWTVQFYGELLCQDAWGALQICLSADIQ